MSTVKQISLTLNGEPKTFETTADETLVDLLRRHGYRGTKTGCYEGACGACTVILDGRAVYGCLLRAFQAHGRDVQTIEGAGSFDDPHPVQRALVDEGAVQCGFCTPGMVLSAKALLDETPHPGSDTIKEHMDGNLCRCTGYEKIRVAVEKVAASTAMP
ncbi:MAG: (2Fe-2S)-binding protein [Kiritimatiellia bacterium]|jgi:carbon-monoxide dehydrogenase small subunit|nr:(2Fe-2S)-binding protein [Kiritimatiellia bacterium]MDP6631760.1 (2Fe-2S)-binding protein [Kiritimatiellia bacterium]MDP6810486.1 (2Fe-2S)-binding protein [Kiritimatiellia bacterium]MDP7024996.1 (2Fe-2S)-binding protein [Kiritimatiellia bacterium]